MRKLISAMALVAAPSVVTAQDIEAEPRLEVVQTSVIGLSEKDADQTSIRIFPEARISLPGQWNANIGLRVEAIDDDARLGTRDTFAPMSRPVTLGSNARLEIDEAVITWREGGSRLTFGKQVFAWGVLDGLQVTDRLDPSRRQESIFIEQRPDRISRWGARAEADGLGLRWDAALIIDGTADQLAQFGDPFAVTAPRFRGGLPMNAPLPSLTIDASKQPTFGLRITRPSGASDLTLLGFHGPETEPLIALDSTGARLIYPDRSLLGLNWQMSSGAQVWRAELAWVPDQPVNFQDGLLRIERRDRVLGGVGLDWTLRGGIFLNAQIGVDHIRGRDLVRPNTDVISTLRLQKAWINDTLRGSAELITSLGDGDGTFRPSLTWQMSDALRVEAGLDYIWGSNRGLIGQFDANDRVWLRLRFSA
ncbi:hypothetical protein [Altererythrobacter sp. MF3-039]|uniref:hypothetical protein n=1 Tax=Altererythrobacter sp. MF3-039 TaxID=3252901 RepID=UPI00390C6F32